MSLGLPRTKPIYQSSEAKPDPSQTEGKRLHEIRDNGDNNSGLPQVAFYTFTSLAEF